MIKMYVEFMFPGSFFSNSTVKEISSRTANIDVPKNCFAYKFFDVYESKAPDGEMIRGARRNESGTFYLGEVLTLDDVKRKYPSKDTLIFNMEANNWDRVVKTIAGNFQPFLEGDVIIPA